MSGSTIDFVPAERLSRRVRHILAMAQQPRGLMALAAETLRDQTRVRIHLEKKDPDGHPWAPWSLKYAKTRKPGHSLLKSSFRMVQELRASSTGTTATVFSLRPYAGVHQGGTVFGPLLAGRGRTPARPYLGMSDSNVRDLERKLAPALTELAARGLAA